MEYQDSVRSPVVNDLDQGVERIVITFGEDTKQEGVANNFDERKKIQKDLGRVDAWAELIGWNLLVWGKISS